MRQTYPFFERAKRRVGMASACGITLLLSVLVCAPTAYGAITNINDAINKAGRQRMLTQRIVKAYCLVGQDVKPKQTTQELEQAVNLFDAQLRELKSFFPEDAITERLDGISIAWRPLKELVTAPPTRANANLVRERAEEVLTYSQQLVSSLQRMSGTTRARLVALAGRQRMLSQRIAAHYLLKSWGLRNPKYDDAFSLALVEFKEALAKLQDSRANTLEISTNLKRVKSQFMIFEYTLKSRAKSSIPWTVSNASTKILAIMDNVVTMYEVNPYQQ